MDIAIIGAGAVARTFMTLLISPESTLQAEGVHIRVKYIFNSKGGIFQEEGVAPELFEKDYDISAHPAFQPGLVPENIKPGEIQLLVDLKSTVLEQAERDFRLCLGFLEKGVHVVCGNKGPVVFGYKRLMAAAKKSGSYFASGCAACAALPSIIVGVDGHAGSKIRGFQGIVNGTTNFILAKMEAGLTYEAALQLAKDEGIAEKNAHNDTSGLDTAIKTVMLANVLWNLELQVSDIAVGGIDKLTAADLERAASSGKKIKLIGTAIMDASGKPQVKVAPEAIGPEHLLYATDEKYKAIVFESGNMGKVLISGSSSLKGAAAAILRDIVNIYARTV